MNNQQNNGITEILKDKNLMREHLKINGFQVDNMSDDDVIKEFNSFGLGKTSCLKKLGVIVP